MTNVATIPRRLRAGPLPHVDQRHLCRNDREAAFAMQAASEYQAQPDPGDEMHGSGGSGPVVLLTLAALLPMALWAVVALVRHLLIQG